MKKSKVIVLLLIVLGIFFTTHNVYADVVKGYYYTDIEINILNDKTNQFETSKISAMYASGHGGAILKPGFYNDMFNIEKGDEVYIIDNQIVLKVPTKEGYYFSGWYLDENFENSFLDSKIDESFDKLNLKLYGKWLKEKPNYTTYIFGKDVATVLFSYCLYDGCDENKSEYIYNINENYLVNNKGRIYDLPYLITLGFDYGNTIEYYQKLEFNTKNKCLNYVNNLINIDDLKTFDESGSIDVYLKFAGSPVCEVSDEEMNDDATSDNVASNISTISEDESVNNVNLYLAIVGSALILVIMIISIRTINKKKVL